MIVSFEFKWNDIDFLVEGNLRGESDFEIVNVECMGQPNSWIDWSYMYTKTQDGEFISFEKEAEEHFWRVVYPEDPIGSAAADLAYDQWKDNKLEA